MSKPKYGILSSSVNPKKLSLTVKGVLLSVVPLALVLLRANDISVTEAELVEAIEQTGAILTLGIALFGSVRKLVVLLSGVSTKIVKRFKK